MLIEPLEYDDPVAVALIDELFDDLTERYGDDVEDDGGAGWYGEVTPEKVRPPHGLFLVASIDGAAAGCGAIKRFDATTAEVKRMYTRERGRRRGVARALLARLEETARDLGYTMIRLETGTKQPEAMQLYESMGYRPITPYGRYRDDPFSRCFEKPL